MNHFIPNTGEVSGYRPPRLARGVVVIYDEELKRLENERDLFHTLLGLADAQDREAFLERALSLVMQVTGAQCGLLELQGQDDRPAWWLAHGFSDDDLTNIREETSRGIVAEALMSGQTVHTAAAQEDERFAEFASVDRNAIQEVLCRGIAGRDCHGVVYLQSPQGGTPFSRDARSAIELFAKHVAPLAAGLLAREPTRHHDATRDYRDRLKLKAFIGRSEALASVFEQLSLVAPLHIHVMLTGESGTGKSALVRSLVANGPRAGRPLVELNCAAIPETLFESELFGAERGAHSTADRAVRGKLSAAEGGTLFLDEIAELPLAAQAKLLHLIQTRKYHPLGSTREQVADVRIVAASNIPLEELVDQGRFRADLMYRLQVLPIRMPSLSERVDDIPELLHHFCRETVRRHELGPVRVGESAVRAAQAAPWPGNVRQLANATEAATIRAHGAGESELLERHVFPSRHREGEELDLTYAEATRAFQRGLLLRTLEDCDWNVSEASRALGIARSHVYNLLESHRIRRES